MSTQDSPLSITASISGILTFVFAILAALYVRLTYLRNADTEYFQVKSSLSWFKTESAWMEDLVKSSHPAVGRRSGVFDMPDSLSGGVGGDGRGSYEGGGGGREGGFESGKGREKEREMYGFVVEQLGKLEERLLECLAEAEEGVDQRIDEGGEKGRKGEQEGWTVIPRGLRGRTDIAINWLPVRTKALELVRQREALGSRVLFAQMSMISS
jgi:hypothetical protein